LFVHYIKYVTGLENARNMYRILVRNLKTIEDLVGVGIDESIILKLILNILDIEAWTGF
jgi:hypothetical protein